MKDQILCGALLPNDAESFNTMPTKDDLWRKLGILYWEVYVKLVVGLVVMLFSMGVLACGPFSPMCACGHRADSYGYGVKAGLFGGDLPSSYPDQVCFNLGMQEGRRAANANVFDCKRSFLRSQNQAMRGKVHSSSLNACNNAGYTYGQAKLRVGARNGDIQAVGQKCVQAYNRGRAQARANRPLSLGSDNLVNACLRAGHYDEGWL